MPMSIAMTESKPWWRTVSTTRKRPVTKTSKRHGSSFHRSSERPHTRNAPSSTAAVATETIATDAPARMPAMKVATDPAAIQ